MRSLVLIALLLACRSNDKPAKRAPKPAPHHVQATAIDVAAFDHTCAAATDCVVVKAALCDPCGCAIDAIASSASAAFDEAGYKLVCPPPDLSVTCAPCAVRVAACEAQRCVAH